MSVHGSFAEKLSVANRRLNADQLAVANKLLALVRSKLKLLSGGRRTLLWALRRKVYKELTYDERGKPTHRRKLKALKREQQRGLCAICKKRLPTSYVVLDRLEGMDGYTAANTRLIHAGCDVKVQRTRGYA